MLRFVYPWAEEAMCFGADPDEWDNETDEARKICTMCRVREPCFAAALKDKYATGMWGGTTEAERKNMRERERQRLKRIAEQERKHTEQEGGQCLLVA